MNNPYQPPTVFVADVAATGGVFPYQIGFTRQVRVVSALLIIQGALESLMGLFIGIATPTILSMEPSFLPPNANLDQKRFFWMMTGIYIAIGLLVMACGGCRIFAGIRNYQFRSRTLGIVACVLGLASVLTCYCFPTSLALSVYGLVVLLNAPVAGAFQVRARAIRRTKYWKCVIRL